MIRYIGIDPGLSGGIALLSNDRKLIMAVDIPTSGEKAKRRVDAPAVQALMSTWTTDSPACAFIERAQAMPKQGASSGFNYGRAVGALEAAVLCSGVALTIIEPAVWKRKLGLIGQGKEASRQRALHLFPGTQLFSKKKDHGIAEAALIAYYGAGL